MKEAGYEWDAENKELKKIEQKSDWSKEDEEMCQETIDWFEKKCFPYALENDNPARESIKWLKSLKERMKGE
jgi:SPX domain protein involved in polyphosphate accumulation